jgi:Ribbon-helix-helix domain
MNHKITVRLTDELLDWLRETSRLTGVPMARLVRDHIESAKFRAGKQRFLRHAGAFTGLPHDRSSRKGFSRSGRP